MEEVDIKKPGFFHLSLELQQEKEEDDIARLETWIKRQEYILSVKEKYELPNPQILAVQNTIAVFMFQIPGRKHQVKAFLEDLLEENGNEQHINTVANLLYVLKELQKDGQYEDEYEQDILSLEGKLLNQDKLCEARALCERGYFYDYQFDEHISDLAQSRIAEKMFEAGIEIGSEEGMSQAEICVWKFYHLDALRKVFSFIDLEYGISDEEINQNLSDIVGIFDWFYSMSDEGCLFYKSRAIVDTILTFTTHQEVLSRLQFFERECQNSMLGDLWKDRISSMELAHEISPNDYHIPARIAKIYCRMSDYDEAVKYTDIALNMESNKTCGSAYNTRMLAYTLMAKDYETKTNQSDLAKECLKKAYRDGKAMEKIYMPVSPSLNMGRICYHLAVDKSQGYWKVPHDKMSYIDEAIVYNKRAINISPGKYNSRGLRQLSDCLWVVNRFEEALSYLRETLQNCEPKMYMHNFKYLLQRYCWYVYNKKEPEQKRLKMVIHIVEDIANTWANIADSEVSILKENLIFFTKRFAKQERYMKELLKHFSQMKPVNGKQPFIEYCKMIQECTEIQPWLQEYSCKFF